MNKRDKITSEREFHNDVFSGRINNRSFTSKFYRMNKNADNFYEKVLHFNFTGKSILEFGCGTGSNFQKVSGTAREYCGVEFLTKQLKLLKEGMVICLLLIIVKI